MKTPPYTATCIPIYVYVYTYVRVCTDVAHPRESIEIPHPTAQSARPCYFLACVRRRMASRHDERRCSAI